MFLAVDTNITIRAAPEAVWDYTCKPENWTASNPTEHFGLRFDSPDNLPHAGVTFTLQRTEQTVTPFACAKREPVCSAAELGRWADS
jgi:hypothetical protein